MNTLNKNIRKTLSEVQRNKKSLVIENNIVTNRFKVILEDKSFFKKSNKEKFFNTITNEINTLKDQGFDKKTINESLVDILKSLFGANSNKVFDAWKEHGVNWLIEKLGVADDEDIVKSIKKQFSNVLVDETPELFTDCDRVTDIVVNAVVESFKNKLSSYNSNIPEATRVLQESILEMVNSEEFQNSVEVKLKNTICPLLVTISTNMTNQEQEIKSRIFPSLGMGFEDTSDLAV